MDKRRTSWSIFYAPSSACSKNVIMHNP
jgi:hypothetical protein